MLSLRFLAADRSCSEDASGSGASHLCYHEINVNLLKSFAGEIFLGIPYACLIKF